MQRFFVCLAIVGGLFSAPFAHAQERLAATTPTELAPGFAACMAGAVSDLDMSECYSAAANHWDTILNANFKKAMDACKDDVNEKDCRLHLREAQRLWMRYRDAMVDVLYPAEGAGTLQRVEANAFLAEETKKQALLLGRDD